MSRLSTAIEQGFDARIKKIYDHLYANGSVRTPIGIATEVDKLLRVASVMENGAGVFPAFSFAPDVRRAISQGEERATIQSIAAKSASALRLSRKTPTYTKERTLGFPTTISPGAVPNWMASSFPLQQGIVSVTRLKSFVLVGRSKARASSLRTVE